MSLRWLRLLLFGVVGLAGFICLAVAAGGLLWLATPNYLDARLTGISRFEIGTEPCINNTGRVVQGVSLYVTRLFVSPENKTSVTIWYISHGWDALSVYVEKSGLIRRMDPLSYDMFLARAIMFSGISLDRNVDDSTQIEMRSTMIVCPT
jgi:hypothetical protein